MDSLDHLAVEIGRPTRNQEDRPKQQNPEGCAPVTNQPQEAERETTPPKPGTQADELQRLYNDFIRFFPAGQAFERKDVDNTPAKLEAFNNLMEAARKYCSRTVIRKRLASGGLWTNDLDNESTSVFDMAYDKILMDLSRRRSRGETVVNFASLARKICTNQCIDYLRSRHPEKNGTIVMPRAGDYSPGTDSAKKSGGLRLTDNRRPGKDGIGSEEIDLPDPKANVTRMAELPLERRWIWQLLYCYVQAMLDYDGEPEKALGVCYGRILYMMADHLNPEFARFDTRAGTEQDPVCKKPSGRCSPSWGMRQMKGKTFGQLRLLSEEKLSQDFGMPLHWGQTFCRKLENYRTVNGVSRPLADIPYDALCTVAQVTGWCNSVHDPLMSRAGELILQDNDLVEYCVENLPKTAAAYLHKGVKK